MTPNANDVRVLIPRVRRAIDGPAATGSAAVSSTLDDEQVTDAIAEIIFYTAGAWSHALNVATRDVLYGAPTAWTVDPPLEEAEATVVTAQAALDYYFHQLAETRISETIRDEGQEWSWATSAAAVSERIAELRAARDRALDLVRAAKPVGVAFVSFLAERDGYTAALVEPYLGGALASREGIWREGIWQ
jgi:hypothetical protein